MRMEKGENLKRLRGKIEEAGDLLSINRNNPTSSQRVNPAQYNPAINLS
jgi:hypothetical protein